MQLSRLGIALAPITLAACGLSVIGVGDEPTATGPDATAPVTVIDAGDAGDGSAVLATGVKGLRSITVGPTGVYVAPTGNVFRIPLPFVAGTPIDANPDVHDVAGLSWKTDTNSLLWIGHQQIGFWQTHALQDTHSNEPDGTDVIYTNGHVIGSFADRVNSYTIGTDNMFGDIVGLAPAQGPQPNGLASDGTNVYWADIQRNIVQKSSLTSSGAAFVENLNAPTSVAVDAENLYVAQVDSIRSVIKGGSGASTSLISNLSKPISLVLDDTNLYWLEAGTGSLQRAPKAGGAVTTLATGGVITDLTMSRLIYLDGAFVYWGQPTDGTVRRLAK